MTELEAIRQRHSVRNYKSDKISPDTIAKLQEMIDTCNKEGNLHFQLCEEAGNTYNRLLNRAMGLGSAPSVIACIGSDTPGAPAGPFGPTANSIDERIGYYGEKIVLFAQSLGLNTCWAGTYNKNGVPATINPGERLVITIAIGYGATPGKQRKSKTKLQVTSGKDPKPDWFDFGTEMALLAPTALNQQKFDIRLNEDDTVTFTDKGGTLSKIDLGIVKYHFEVGANHIKNETK